MKKKNRIIIAAIVAGLIAITGVAYLLSSNYNPTSTSHGAGADSYTGVVDTLRANSATVEPVGSIEQPFFSAKGSLIEVNKQEVQVFEYPDVGAAKADVAKVSPDAQTIGSAKPTWSGTPHLFQKGKVIVVYIGSDTSVLTLLSTALGPQFAGGDLQVTN